MNEDLESNKEFNPQDVRLNEYKKEYSESGLWEKIASVAKKAGKKVIFYALLLYYALQSPRVSISDKAKIIGALGYFILPADIIPDFIPVGGYVDDGGVLLLVIKMLGNIDESVKKQAEQKLTEWFDKPSGDGNMPTYM